ncbi:hypothetical protein BGX27_002331 [Mortierella sp. AM989]|nr:hypothetical protein BGX27_002331 [Mortierella sp. AM989]
MSSTTSMAHLTPLALQLTNPSPSNIDDITTGCSKFFKTNCPSKWLAEEYIKIDSTFDTYLDTLKHIGKKKTSISALCTNLYQYYQSSDGQKQLKLLKQQRSTLLSKEIAKSSTHGGVYDDIDYDNNRGRNAPWSDNQTSAELNEEAIPNSSSSSEHYTMKEVQQIDDDKATTTSTAAPIIKGVRNRLEETEAEQSKRRRVSFGSTVSTTTTKSTSTSGSLYSYKGSETPSESNMYVYNFLVGGGRKDSRLKTLWTHNGINISEDLMTFRDRVVQDNFGISEPHEMLVVNFIFLLESENQAWGLQGEVQDHIWESMWDCVGKIEINNLESNMIVECYKWAGLAAINNFDEFSNLLKNQPPSSPLLHQVLLQLTSSQQLWSLSGLENEATFIRYLIDPCLNATFGSIKNTSSNWTTLLNETRGQDSRLLFPDFSVVTQLRSNTCSLLHMEGKTTVNKGRSQMWDDLTKLGQELKQSLDTMIMQEPSGSVSVIGILLTAIPFVGFNLKFFEMKIQSEGVYILKKYAECYLFNKAENMFSLCRLLDILETTKVHERTLLNLRAVKIKPSDTPLVPISWLRPSYVKPRKMLLPD